MKLKNVAGKNLDSFICFNLSHQFSESIKVDFLDDIDFLVINFAYLWQSSQYLKSYSFIYNEKWLVFSQIHSSANATGGHGPMAPYIYATEYELQDIHEVDNICTLETLLFLINCNLDCLLTSDQRFLSIVHFISTGITTTVWSLHLDWD